jgi:hypothetical protein
MKGACDSIGSLPSCDLSSLVGRGGSGGVRAHSFRNPVFCWGALSHREFMSQRSGVGCVTC